MDNSGTDSGDNVIRRPEGRYVIWQDDALPPLDERQFNPSGYERAEPIIGKGGRGSAWFVEIAGIPAVLKHYRRGGWAAKLSSDWYWGLHDRDSRSFQEMNLLHYLCDEGLPVPRPLAAFRFGRFGFYQAAILTERIAGARSLVEAVSAGDAPWSAVGQTLAKFHVLDIRHADLNANNILIDPSGKVHFIDWDKGDVVSHDNGWRGRVIDRLVRSLCKECAGSGADALASGLVTMRRAYERELV